MRKMLDIVLTINLLVLIVFVVYLWWVGTIELRFNHAEEVEEVVDSAYTNQAYIFGETIKVQIIQEQGAPKEGYTPPMVLAAFPGFAITDFENVETSVGSYMIENGKLEHVTTPGALLHSAADAISRPGFETLLRNVSDRLQIDLNRDGTITQVMEAVTK